MRLPRPTNEKSFGVCAQPKKKHRILCIIGNEFIKNIDL